MRFEDLNWFDVENYLKQDDRLILVFGACEQHGYLSLLADAKIPLALADAASKQTGVLIAPPLNFGVSPYFLKYPGTISLRTTTLLDVAEDIIRAVHQHGFHRVLVLNGHGGNDPVRARFYELVNQLPELHMAWYAWWQAPSIGAIAQKYGLKSYHAGWIEAFPFTRVGEIPEGEKSPLTIPGLLNADEIRCVYGDGVFGGPYRVEESILQEVFDTALQDVLQLLRFE
jgi:creatinine amidohydrolase